MSCHADEEKYQFLERIFFLYKNQIIELHQQHYDLEKKGCIMAESIFQKKAFIFINCQALYCLQ